MKILFIIDKMHNFAGIERILSCKMNYLSEQTPYQILFTTYEQQSQKLPFQLNCNISYKPINVNIPQRNRLSFLRWFLSYFLSRRQFKRQYKVLVKENRPDIVVCTAYSYQVFDIIINTNHHLGIKTIMESHTKGETVTMAYKFKYNHRLYSLFSLWDYHIMKSLKHCQYVVTLTKQDLAFWESYTQHIEVIPNMLTIKPKRVVDYGAKRIISAGRYMSEKGFDRLLEAWYLINNLFNDWHLYIFGDGDRAPYQKIAGNYKIDNSVHLMPATDDIAEEFSKSSIYVMSSRYEGFGLVLAEAMSCGLPCISFDCPYGPRDIITDGEDGILVENGNIEALSKAIERLMIDESLRQSMGEKAIINVARYNSSIIMNLWEELFSSL